MMTTTEAKILFGTIEKDYVDWTPEHGYFVSRHNDQTFDCMQKIWRWIRHHGVKEFEHKYLTKDELSYITLSLYTWHNRLIVIREVECGSVRAADIIYAIK